VDRRRRRLPLAREGSREATGAQLPIGLISTHVNLRVSQQFIEINAIGFRKILKKFDKHSKSTTKELYLSRQVDIQPVFNRQVCYNVTSCWFHAYDVVVAANI
jgi:SPX domain protein involved in polyphosphate accumulation